MLKQMLRDASQNQNDTTNQPNKDPSSRNPASQELQNEFKALKKEYEGLKKELGQQKAQN